MKSRICKGRRSRSRSSSKCKMLTLISSRTRGSSSKSRPGKYPMTTQPWPMQLTRRRRSFRILNRRLKSSEAWISEETTTTWTCWRRQKPSKTTFECFTIRTVWLSRRLTSSSARMTSLHTVSSETDQTRPLISETRIEPEETPTFKIMKKVKDNKKVTDSTLHKPPIDKTSKSRSERKTW